MNFKIKAPKLNFEGFIEIKKAYTEGVYADSPLNRKLGRVGMSYKDYQNKIKNNDSKLKDFEENIINNDDQIKLFYKTKEGEFVGEVVVVKEPEEETLYLEHIFVHPNFQKRGIANEILDKILNISKKENGFKKIELYVDHADNQFTNDLKLKEKNNKYLIDLYKKKGFDFKTEHDKKALNPYMIKIV